MPDSVLSAFGVTELEERCYLKLLERPGLRRSELSSLLGIGGRRLTGILADLERKGLVSRSPAKEGEGYVPARPDLAVEALILRWQQHAEAARTGASRLLQVFERGAGSRVVAAPVDVITGVDAIAQHWRQIQRGAHREVMIFDKPPYVGSPEAPNPVELDLLPRGIRYRILYDETSLATPGKLESARRCVAAGEDARVLAGVPMKLIMADGDLALTHDIEESEVKDAIIVRSPPLVRGLSALFESLWARGVPLPFGLGPEEQHEELEMLDAQILALLASGAKDESICRQLGLSGRSLSRRISHTMQTLSARTRFQAGVRARDEGMIGTQADPRDRSRSPGGEGVP